MDAKDKTWYTYSKSTGKVRTVFKEKKMWAGRGYRFTETETEVILVKIED